jgi:ArsR family transcriptional regulator
MAIASKEKFKSKEVLLAEFAKALAHPARLAILMTLAEKKECICGDLVLDLPLAQSTVSQHLKALKEIGLIKGTIDGPKSKYCIDWAVFGKFQGELSTWSEQLLKYRSDICC